MTLDLFSQKPASSGLVTIWEAQQFLDKHKAKGAICPCCGRFTKVYKRQIYSKPARMLIMLYHADKRNPGKVFHHVDDIGGEIQKKGGSAGFSKLRYWNLVTEAPKDPDKTNSKTSGQWAITHRGRLYVERQIKLPKYANVYKNELIGFSGENIDIADALGKQFNYQELMKG